MANGPAKLSRIASVIRTVLEVAGFARFAARGNTGSRRIGRIGGSPGRQK